MTFDKDAVLSLLKDTFLHEDFPFTEEDTWRIINTLNIPSGKKSTDYIFDSGATKFVIIPNDTDYVIKIPFTGQINDWDGEYNEYEFGEGDDPWNYCENEVMRFAQAKFDGFSEFFAETKLIGYKDGFPIYIQEKCTCLTTIKDRHSKYSEVEKEKTLEITEYCGIDLTWLTDVRLMYGEDTCKWLVDYVDDNGWNDDLRPANIGYLNNKPIIFDYSSYNEY